MSANISNDVFGNAIFDQDDEQQTSTSSTQPPTSSIPVATNSSQRKGEFHPTPSHKSQLSNMLDRPEKLSPRNMRDPFKITNRNDNLTDAYDINETSPLLNLSNAGNNYNVQSTNNGSLSPTNTSPSARPSHSDSIPNISVHLEADEESLMPTIKSKFLSNCQKLKTINKETILDECIIKPIRLIPSVFLGVLLNILDGLSYGMIMFPIGEPIFSHLGPAGLSMFYVSCIVSQLVYSLGGSAFAVGIGSEMIEVTPFFHSMALSIMYKIGTDQPDAILATTITAFCISSVVTGVAFFILGYMKLGELIGFFPRHILVGCIGGIGYFLVVTGIEVSSRLSGSLEYNLATFTELFLNFDTFIKWFTPLVLAILLIFVQKFNNNAIVVPAYFIVVFAVFHIIIAAVPWLSIEKARDNGWLFDLPATNEPWYEFYSLFDFRLVHWNVLLETFPTMLALTFFGILHVPINVPALAVSVEMDRVDVDRELVAHGISNVLSGMIGSIQNYLVYTNSVLFRRSGADSRLAGVMLAIGTGIIMVIGPVVVGYIPIMVVGALIFLLGLELLVESIIEPYHKVSKFEYITIIVMVVSMGALDFVLGIVIGIIMACITFTFQQSQNKSIRATHSGINARSLVRRPAFQKRFLTKVGEQIKLLKLTGSIFFGKIVQTEKFILELFDNPEQSIRYLILDMSDVTDIDFSAAEAFTRVKRLVASNRSYLIISSVQENSVVLSGLKAVGVLDDDKSSPKGEIEENDKCYSNVQLFTDLNSTLEWCENEFLTTYYTHRDHYEQQSQLRELTIKDTGNGNAGSLSVTSQPLKVDNPMRAFSIANFSNSPRNNFVRKAANSIIQQDTYLQTSADSNLNQWKEPLPLLLTVLQDISDQPIEFWKNLSPFLTKLVIRKDHIIYRPGMPVRFFIVESGLLRADFDIDSGSFSQSVLPGTAFGESFFYNNSLNTCPISEFGNIDTSLTSLVAEAESVIWYLDSENLKKLQESDDCIKIYNELLLVALKLMAERFKTVTEYVIISSN